jgi:hypothetical protein
MKNEKFEKVILGGFQLPEVRKYKLKSRQINICDFHCIAEHKGGLLKDVYFISALQPDLIKSS